MSKRPWTEETINAAIDEWHESDTQNVNLQDYLELSVNEYHLFVTNPTAFFYREEMMNWEWVVINKNSSHHDIGI